MAAGRKTGGRQKGTPNKKTQALSATLEKYNHDPVEALILAALDTELDIPLKIKINMELMQYIYPKRKAMELSGDPDNPLETSLTVKFKDVD